MDKTWPFLLKLLQQAYLTNQTLCTIEDFSSINQEKLFVLLTQHRLILLALPLLKRILPQQHPMLHKLQAASFPLLAKNLLQQKVLLTIAAYFQHHAIPYVALKGPALNQLLYQQQCCRYSTDLDILISPEQAQQVHKILIAQGFSLAKKDKEKIITDAALFSRAKPKDMLYLSSNKEVAIEIHYYTNYLYSTSISVHDKLPLAQVTLQQQAISILSNEENFIYLCWHGAKHRWARLQWLVDLAMLQKNLPLNWPKVAHQAKYYHYQRSVQEALLLLNKFFNLQIKLLPLSTWDTWIIKWHLLFVKKRWQDSETRHVWWVDTLFQALLYPGIMTKLHFFVNRLTNSDDALNQLMLSPSRTKLARLALDILKRLKIKY